MRFCRPCYEGVERKPVGPKKKPRTVASIVAAYEPGEKTDTPPIAANLPGQVVLDMLREAAAAGEKPSRLRTESGLEPTIFRTLMSALMDAGAVVRERVGTNKDVLYRLKEFALSPQSPLATAAAVALDGRD